MKFEEDHPTNIIFLLIIIIEKHSNFRMFLIRTFFSIRTFFISIPSILCVCVISFIIIWSKTSLLINLIWMMMMIWWKSNISTTTNNNNNKIFIFEKLLLIMMVKRQTRLEHHRWWWWWQRSKKIIFINLSSSFHDHFWLI